MALSKMKTNLIEIGIVIILLALVGFCFGAWDNTLPADNNVWNTAAAMIRANWDALEVELGVNLNEAHPYYQAGAPAFKPDGATAFDADDLGRIWIDSDNNRIYVLTATTPTWSDIILEIDNNTYITAVDAAGTGTVNLIMANASDDAQLPDGAELATSAAPTADEDIANKLYVDDRRAYVKLVDSKATTTDGGTFTQGAWQKRTVTEETDTGTNCSVTASVFVLAAGTYECRISCPALKVNAHQARLRNTTGGTTLLVGTAGIASAASTVSGFSHIVGRFTIAGAQDLEIQHKCAATEATDGFGVASDSGEVEIYTIAEFWRI